MPEDHPERHEARLSQPFVLFAPDLRSVDYGPLRSRSPARVGACPSASTPSPEALEEDPMMGVPSPFVPLRGSWRTLAAAPVEGAGEPRGHDERSPVAPSGYRGHRVIA